MSATCRPRLSVGLSRTRNHLGSRILVAQVRADVDPAFSFVRIAGRPVVIARADPTPTTSADAPGAARRTSTSAPPAARTTARAGKRRKAGDGSASPRGAGDPGDDHSERSADDGGDVPMVPLLDAPTAATPPAAAPTSSADAPHADRTQPVGPDVAEAIGEAVARARTELLDEVRRDAELRDARQRAATEGLHAKVERLEAAVGGLCTMADMQALFAQHFGASAAPTPAATTQASEAASASAPAAAPKARKAAGAPHA